MHKKIFLSMVCIVALALFMGTAIAASDVMKSPTEELMVQQTQIGTQVPKAEVYPAVLTTDGKEQAKTIKAAVQKEGTEKEAYKAVQKAVSSEVMAFTLIDKPVEVDTGQTNSSAVQTKGMQAKEITRHESIIAYAKGDSSATGALTPILLHGGGLAYAAENVVGQKTSYEIIGASAATAAKNKGIVFA